MSLPGIRGRGGPGQHGVPTLVDLAAAVDDGGLRPHHGTVDLAEVARFAPRVRRAATAVDGPADALSRIDAGGLASPLGRRLGTLQDELAAARSAIDTAADAFSVMPTMMGGHGPRSFLLLVLNNAEVRSSGGMPGSWAVLHARRGHLSMGRQGSAADLGTLDRSPVRLRPAERALYGSGLGSDLRDVTSVPDFPRSARLAAALFRQRTGIRVDGVLAVDPVAMGLVLDGTGPVAVGRGVRLDAADVAQVLLHRTYTLLPTQAAQDDFNERAARRIFDAMVAGQGSAVRTVHGLVAGVGQRRVLAWSRHPAIDRVLRGNRLSGALPGTTGAAPQVGVYLDDAGAGKMEYYLRSDTSVTATGCTARGEQTLTVSTTLTSVAPRSVTAQPVWVTGTGHYTPRGSILLNVRLYGPSRRSITSLQVDGRPATIYGGTHAGRQVAIVPLRIDPGQGHTITATMHTLPGRRGDVVVTTTPGVEPRPDPVTEPSACR